MRVEGKIEFARLGKRKVVWPRSAPVGPRISRLMTLAIKMQGIVDRGEVKDYAELTRLAQVTRARMTQIMNFAFDGDTGKTAVPFLPVDAMQSH